MTNPDGWSANPDGTWNPPQQALQDPINSHLEVPPNVTKSTIRDGSLEVRDAVNALRVLLGKGVDGDYDLSIFDADGNEVKFSSLAFELTADSVEATETTLSFPYVDLATPGPEVTVDVGPTGKVVVSWGCFCQVTATNAAGPHAGDMAFEVSGANTIAAGASNRRARLNIGTTVAAESVTSGANVFASAVLEGLTPGSTTFTAKYKLVSGATFAAAFSVRFISVQPL